MSPFRRIRSRANDPFRDPQSRMPTPLRPLARTGLLVRRSWCGRRGSPRKVSYPYLFSLKVEGSAGVYQIKPAEVPAKSLRSSGTRPGGDTPAALTLTRAASDKLTNPTSLSLQPNDGAA